MVKNVFFALLLFLIAFIDGYKVFKSKDIKKIVIYSLIFFSAGMLSLVLLRGVKIPNPMDPVKNLIVSIFGKE